MPISLAVCVSGLAWNVQSDSMAVGRITASEVSGKDTPSRARGDGLSNPVVLYAACSSGQTHEKERGWAGGNGVGCAGVAVTVQLWCELVRMSGNTAGIQGHQQPLGSGASRECMQRMSNRPNTELF